MTREEAIYVLQENLNWKKENRYPYVSDREASAYILSIQSIKSWEDIEADIKEELQFGYNDENYKQGLKTALEILHKHLKEVEE